MPLPINKIAKIHISNFKFFDKARVIDFDTKNHLLVYGENGSGKSSIYWALYTLFECSLKERPEIEKYFKKGGKDSLVNIYAPTNKHSYVKIELDNGTTFQISPTDFSIIDDAPTSTSVQAINLASDFINYRLLYRFHDLKNSKDFEVFDFLFSEILMYLTIPTLGNKKANKVWEELLKGPEKDYDTTGTLVYPVPNDVSTSDKQIRGLQTKYKAYRKKLNDFNKWLRGLLKNVEQIANETLKDDLKQPFKIKIDFKSKDPAYDRVNPEIYNPKIFIEVPELNGKKVTIKKPHTFLNEARLTALAIAIRIGILKSRTTDANLRFLILDDLLISLDMSNRDTILDVVIKKLSADYQLLVLTHDKIFYEFVEQKIKENKETENWKQIEMYCSLDSKPIIIQENTTNIDKAKKYLATGDYSSAGNNIRIAIEKELDYLLPETIKVTFRDLEDAIKKLFEYYKDNNCLDLIDAGLEARLLQSKTILLNPSSHYDLRYNLFKTEVEKAIDLYDALKQMIKIEREILVGMRGTLRYSNLASNYVAEYTLIENLYAIKVTGLATRTNLPKHHLNFYQQNGIPFFDPNTGSSKTPIQNKTAKERIIKFSDRFVAISIFLQLAATPTINEFLLPNGTSIQTLIDNLVL